METLTYDFSTACKINSQHLHKINMLNINILICILAIGYWNFHKTSVDLCSIISILPLYIGVSLSNDKSSHTFDYLKSIWFTALKTFIMQGYRYMAMIYGRMSHSNSQRQNCLAHYYRMYCSIHFNLKNIKAGSFFTPLRCWMNGLNV